LYLLSIEIYERSDNLPKAIWMDMDGITLDSD
jgi:hypothetical protein